MTMNKKMFYKLAPSIITIFITVVALALATSAFGWFSSNINVGVTGMGVRTEVSDAEAEYVVYIYDVKNSVVHYTGETETSADPSLDNLDMQFHDMIFLQRNRYTPAVVRIRLSQIKDKFADGGYITVTLYRDLSIAKYAGTIDNPKINNYFTSAMRFSLAQNKNWYNSNSLTLYSNVDDGLYNKIVIDPSTNTNPVVDTKVFTTVELDGEDIASIEKENTIVLEVPYTASDIVDDVLDIYLYITYDSELISHMDLTTAIGSEVTTMVNDIDLIDIKFSLTSMNN